MTEPRDLRELVGADVPDGELDLLRPADQALRRASPPPQVPGSLTARVLAGHRSGRHSSTRRALAGLAVAAAIAGAAFGIGVWTSGEDRPVADVIALEPMGSAPAEAEMVIAVLPLDEAGNWRMSADVSGLPPLAEGGLYELWLTQGGRLAAPCGRFRVDDDGTASNIWLTAPYRFKQFDRWVVVAVTPGTGERRRMLDGPVVEAADVPLNHVD